MEETKIKLTFILGLKNVVLEEISSKPKLNILYQGNEDIYLDFNSDISEVLQLKSILNAYIIKQGDKLNPYFLSKHKSYIGEIIEIVLKNSTGLKSFKISCAGPDSKEVRSIKRFVADTYKMEELEEADMEIFIGKSNSTWELGVRITNRPLSLREYKVENIKGGLNPTIAYAMNTFCNLNSAKSYLNIFSGSATLLIEAGLIKKDLKIIGFDNNGKSNALAIKNIKKAGLIKSIQLKTEDIFDKPELGEFDVITSDLPFGMQVSKGENLEKLYETFIEYSEGCIEQDGVLVVYTTEYELLSKIIEKSKFSIVESIDLKVSTIVNSYIYPKIFICKLKS